MLGLIHAPSPRDSWAWTRMRQHKVGRGRPRTQRGTRRGRVLAQRRAGCGRARAQSWDRGGRGRARAHSWDWAWTRPRPT
jgi:hypothetical protein